MSRAIRLGRGLASLMPDAPLQQVPDPEPEPTLSDPGLLTVPITEIEANPEQPRQVFDSEHLQSLSASIARHGILTPLVVRREAGSYILIAGERRLRAAGLAGLMEVPVVVRDAESPEEQLELALVENLQRADLDPIESARGFQRLIELYGYTQDQVANAVAKDRSTVANAVRLLKLPSFVLQTLREGRITAGHARALLPLVQDVEELRMALARVLAQNLSVRATERLVADKVRVAPVRATPTKRRSTERAMAYATRLLQDALHTHVAIQTKRGGGGKISIDFADGEDLERLIGLLRAE